MSSLNFTVVEHQEDHIVFGLSKPSNDSTQAKDIPALSNRYYQISKTQRGEVIPFYVVSKDYNESTKDFLLFVGGLTEKDNLETLVIPKGIYGKVSVTPIMGLFWGAAIGRAKRSFYRRWLAASGYEALNMEYEYHSQASTGNTPSIDILFAIDKCKV